MASYHLSVKSGKKGKAAEHAAYVVREGKHTRNAEDQDLVTMSYGNLPAWANGDPQIFWKAADKYERANGAAYREYELALPRELNTEQHRELINEFVEQVVGEKTFLVVIHEPIAALGGVKQPHSHCMISDRLPDGIDRTPEQHFSRYNSRHPELGGCKKDSGGKAPAVLKEELVATRKCWADMQNRAFERLGVQAEVDHRSNVERGVQRPPERHLGQSGVRKMSEEEKMRYLDERQRM